MHHQLLESLYHLPKQLKIVDHLLNHSEAKDALPTNIPELDIATI